MGRQEGGDVGKTLATHRHRQNRTREAAKTTVADPATIVGNAGGGDPSASVRPQDEGRSKAGGMAATGRGDWAARWRGWGWPWSWGGRGVGDGRGRRSLLESNDTGNTSSKQGLVDKEGLATGSAKSGSESSQSSRGPPDLVVMNQCAWDGHKAKNEKLKKQVLR